VIVPSSFARSEAVRFLHIVRVKNKCYSNNPRTEDDVKYSIQSLVSSVSPPEILLAVNMKTM
jgi:hypothetical protein